jgi:hypothetical protein
MLIESAFSVLPEAVAGYGFQKVKREANAVGVFAFSLLNTLHAKNILDPIQRIQLEQTYGTKSLPLPVGVNRRDCDIFLDYGGSKIGSAKLANYGWRYRNYVEAKYLKSYSQTPSGQDTRASKNTAEVIADLIRLVALVPEPEISKHTPTPKTSSARYLLVLADKAPDVFIIKYLTAFHKLFECPTNTGSIDFNLGIGKQSKALASNIGRDFNNIRLEINRFTCFLHYPIDNTIPDICWMMLLRIDSATISLIQGANLHSFSIGQDRLLTETNQGDYQLIRDFVATNIC